MRSGKSVLRSFASSCMKLTVTYMLLSAGGGKRRCSYPWPMLIVVAIGTCIPAEFFCS